MLIYTLGHSTRNLEEFINLLKHYKIEFVVDVRRFPSSKKFPHFNKENLEKELEKNGIKYIHFPELGGFREGGYKNFSKTEEFKNSLKRLLGIIDNHNSTILCAEKYFWRCHRKYIAHELHKLGHRIIHILDKNDFYEHKESKDLEFKMNVKIFCDKIRNHSSS
jgi:uncharacterized protein (DUF488 family)